MADYTSIRAGQAAGLGVRIDAGLRTHMNKVYGNMSVGMLITAAAAWAVAGLAVTADPTGASVQIGADKYLTGFGQAIYLSPLKWVIMFAPLAFIFLGMGTLMRRASPAAVQLGFFVFATLMGLSLSSIFLVFTGFSIVQTFLVTAISFAGLSLWGYTTKRDISAWGAFLIMGVIGLIVASIVNLFLGSDTMSLAISALGVLIFAGLTAYDTQNIKVEYIAHAQHGDAAWLEKSAIMGAMTLYLDFINMFTFLLQFLGNRE